MKLTNAEITTLYEGLWELRKRIQIALPIQVGFAIIQDMKILQPIYETVIEMRNHIYFEHKESTDEDTQMVRIKVEDVDIVNKKLKELGDIPNELDLRRIPLPQLLSLSLTLDDIDILYPIIEPTSE